MREGSPLNARLSATDLAARKAVGLFVAVGLLAVGAVAVGAFAIGRLSVGRAHVGRLQIDELDIGRLRRDDEV